MVNNCVSKSRDDPPSRLGLSGVEFLSFLCQNRGDVKGWDEVGKRKDVFF